MGAAEVVGVCSGANVAMVYAAGATSVVDYRAGLACTPGCHIGSLTIGAVIIWWSFDACSLVVMLYRVKYWFINQLEMELDHHLVVI